MKSRAYRQYISTIPCLICGNPEVQVHHLLRTGEHGIGKKSGDEWCVPLCVIHHGNLHRVGNEIEFFHNLGKPYDIIRKWCVNTYSKWEAVNGKPKEHGGKRKNAGRKKGSGKWGVPTKPMRVPVKIWYEVEKFVKDKMNDTIKT